MVTGGHLAWQSNCPCGMFSSTSECNQVAKALLLQAETSRTLIYMH